MKRIYTQSESVSLYSGIESTFDFNGNSSRIIITSQNITPKQWSSLLLELNLVVEAWRPYAHLELKAPGLKKVLTWGRRKHGQ